MCRWGREGGGVRRKTPKCSFDFACLLVCLFVVVVVVVVVVWEGECVCVCVCVCVRACARARCLFVWVFDLFVCCCCWFLFVCLFVYSPLALVTAKGTRRSKTPSSVTAGSTASLALI